MRSREVLSAFGTLGPADYGDEVNRLEAVLATSSLRQRSLAELARLVVPGDPRVLSLMITRGALYATRLDATVRARSKGKRSLRDVLQRLLATAEERKSSSLSLSDFLAMLGEEAGAGEPAEFQSFLDGRKRELPDSSLGPCFVQGRRTYRELAVGFDRSATESEAKVVGLEKGGPADGAGLREGDVVDKVTVVETTAGATVTVVVKRESKETTISYPAKTASLPGWGWTRRKEVRDDKCDLR